MEKIVRDNLLAIVASYRKATGKSLTQVSKEFYGRGDFFEKLRRGEHSVSVEKLGTMLDQFREDWPADAEWPLTRPVFMGRRATQ